MSACDIKHGFGDQRCIRPVGHKGACRSKVYPNHETGTLTYSRWVSENGKFKDHLGYYTSYPRNAVRQKP